VRLVGQQDDAARQRRGGVAHLLRVRWKV
jgi:hypothetical protein